MAGYLSLTTDNGDAQFSVGDILALAAELKRRKVSRTVRVEILGHETKGQVTALEMRVPCKVKRIVLPTQEVKPTKTPMRGAKKGR